MVKGNLRNMPPEFPRRVAATGQSRQPQVVVAPLLRGAGQQAKDAEHLLFIFFPTFASFVTFCSNLLPSRLCALGLPLREKCFLPFLIRVIHAIHGPALFFPGPPPTSMLTLTTLRSTFPVAALVAALSAEASALADL